MKLWRGALILAGGAWLAGCATEAPRYPIRPPPPPPFEAPPPPPPATPPPASVSGRVAAPAARPGERWSCEGQSVVLLAADAAAEARMQGLYGSNVAAASPVETVRKRAAALNAGAQAEAPVASATCSDSEGFTLAGIRAGGYFLVARAKLTSPGGAVSYALMRRVALRPGETAVVTLPDERTVPRRPARPRPPLR